MVTFSTNIVCFFIQAANGMTKQWIDHTQMVNHTISTDIFPGKYIKESLVCCNERRWCHASSAITKISQEAKFYDSMCDDQHSHKKTSEAIYMLSFSIGALKA